MCMLCNSVTHQKKTKQTKKKEKIPHKNPKPLQKNRKQPKKFPQIHILKRSLAKESIKSGIALVSDEFMYDC